MKGCEFIQDSVNVLSYNLNKISLNRCGSYIDSVKCFKDKKSTMVQNQYAVTVVLNQKIL